MIEHQTSNDPGTQQPRDVQRSVLRGLGQKCPACGDGSIYRAYLTVNDACPKCGEELHHHRADDAPPYFTMLIFSAARVIPVYSQRCACSRKA